MYCPRCGAPTEVRDSWLTCTATGADFSVQAYRDLTSMVETEPTEDKRSAGHGGSMPWFCPADGSRLEYVSGTVTCGVCARVLPQRLRYALLEFNFHPG
jgi:hypothetical protein